MDLRPLIGIADSPPSLTLEQVISPYMGVFFAAFLISIFGTPIMGYIASRLGVVDQPDKIRKLHERPIAYFGGLALLLAWLAGIMASMSITPHSVARDSTIASVGFPASIVLGAMVITFVGLWDDIDPIKPRYKLCGQFVAALFLVAGDIGTRIVGGALRSLGSAMGWDIVGSVPPLVITLLGALLVVFFVVGACNSTNLLDGLDGLASGVIALVTLAMTFLAVALALGVYPGDGPYSPHYDPIRLVFCISLLGAVLGFLPYNFKPANIFMGDAGSMLLGYLTVTIILMLGEKGDPLLVMAGLTIFAVPILDTALAIARCIARRVSLASADAHHLHHLLVKAGLGVRRAVIAIYALTFAFACLGCAMLFFRLRFVAAVFMVLFSFVAVMAFKIGQRYYLADQARRAARAARAEELGTDVEPAREGERTAAAPVAKPATNTEPLFANSNL